ncbi:hypothetical protein [Roseateles depolymerans]|uniref:Uncharacterized protein n=1 Tax=Roseateles depolymerans TaxID=76731 RepID=A0A0U3NHN9_9BURK|nr:hypothetical protein [Roseateles depolymerans]ALV07920.1 hypothetical protein RD2015_3463 [Roseateles depolymerans]REG21859.1 hypothetical protein DES44_0988 [Roseateles depolymerans]
MLVTPFVAGSGPDHVARTLARAWSARTGESVTVLNLPEDQGRTAARWVAERGTDGRLVLLTSARMLDAGPVMPRTQRQRPEATPPIALARFRMLAPVGQQPFMSVFPADLLPGPMRRQPSPLNGIPPNPRILTALARNDELTAGFNAGILPPLLSRPDDFPRTDWNGLLVSAAMPKVRAEALQQLLSALLALPEVRWAVGQAGSDLWEDVPQPPAVEVAPLRR